MPRRRSTPAQSSGKSKKRKVDPKTGRVEHYTKFLNDMQARILSIQRENISEKDGLATPETGVKVAENKVKISKLTLEIIKIKREIS